MSLTAKKSGLILPPPELRNIIDKTAQYVAKNGVEFEARIKENERSNPKFCFLILNDPYRPYYDHKVQDYKNNIQGGIVEEKEVNKPDGFIETKPKETKPIPTEPYLLSFLTEIPIMSTLDYDIIKLTALFVARNGRSFLVELYEKEKYNPQFEFLKATSPLFPLFNKLIEEYSQVLSPSDPAVLFYRLSLCSESKSNILDACVKRGDYIKYKSECEKNAQESANKEKDLFQSIDWYDFVVVETLDFNPIVDDTRDDFLRPIDEQWIIQTSLQQRNDLALQRSKTETIQVNGNQNNTNEEQEMEMDVEEDEQLPFANEPPMPTVIPGKEYIPRALAMKQQIAIPLVKCAVCKQLIPENELEEHIKIETLDPKFREQRKIYEDRIKDSNLLQGGSDIARNLKMLATRRTDIFGKEEVEIGKKVGEEGVTTAANAVEREKVIWDGTMSSATATRVAQITQTMTKNVPLMPSISKMAPSPFPPMPPPQFPAMPSSQFPAMPSSQFPAMPPMVPPPIPILSAFPIPNFMPPLPPTATVGAPDTKKHKIDPVLDTVTIRIQVPKEPSLSQFKLAGQTITLQLSLSNTTINELKDLLASQVGLPNTRQKLSIGANVPRNNQTLLEAGLQNNSTLQLALKERGGKK